MKKQELYRDLYENINKKINMENGNSYILKFNIEDISIENDNHCQCLLEISRIEDIKLKTKTKSLTFNANVGIIYQLSIELQDKKYLISNVNGIKNELSQVDIVNNEDSYDSKNEHTELLKEEIENIHSYIESTLKGYKFDMSTYFPPIPTDRFEKILDVLSLIGNGSLVHLKKDIDFYLSETLSDVPSNKAKMYGNAGMYGNAEMYGNAGSFTNTRTRLTEETYNEILTQLGHHADTIHDDQSALDSLVRMPSKDHFIGSIVSSLIHLSLEINDIVSHLDTVVGSSGRSVMLDNLIVNLTNSLESLRQKVEKVINKINSQSRQLESIVNV